MFRWLFQIPRLRLCSIILHDIYPELREISDDWIHDPQMWDLWLDGQPDLSETEWSRRVEVERGERVIMIYIDAANGIKGFSGISRDCKTRGRTISCSCGRSRAT